MKLFDKTWKLALSGVVIGLLVMLLAMSGNPANMAICVACFIRDAAGALKLHTAAPVQYFRPEIVGFVCGSVLISIAGELSERTDFPLCERRKRSVCHCAD